MFGIGETELALILLFGFLLFGPDKLPGIGRTVGRALRQMRAAQDSVTKVLQTELLDPMNESAQDNTSSKIEDELDTDKDSTSAKETFAQKKARSEQVNSSSTSNEDPDEPEKGAEPAADESVASADPTSASALYGLYEPTKPDVVVASKKQGTSQTAEAKTPEPVQPQLTTEEESKDASDSVKEEGTR